MTKSPLTEVGEPGLGKRFFFKEERGKGAMESAEIETEVFWCEERNRLGDVKRELAENNGFSKVGRW